VLASNSSVKAVILERRYTNMIFCRSPEFAVMSGCPEAISRRMIQEQSGLFIMDAMGDAQ
jgi:hypothetical protein